MSSITPEEYYVKLPNDFYDNLSISNEEMTILILLYRNYQQYKNLGMCSIQIICDLMRINVSNNRKLITTIKDTIIELINKGYIIKLYNLYCKDHDNKGNKLSINSIIKDKDSVFYAELITPPETSYFKIFDEEINYIFEELASKNLNKFNIIRYFIACRRVSGNDSKFGYLTQGKLKQLVTDSRTIQRYNKILQDDLHLIRYNNSFLTPDKHYCTTYIGHWDDEVNFNYQLKAEVEGKGLIYTDKTQSNERRSVQQKINNVDSLTLEELEELIRKKKELEYKPVVKKEDDKIDIVDNRSVTDIKGKGLQNKKQKPLPLPKIYNKDNEPPDIFEDLFGDEEENDYWDISNLTIEEQKALQEIEDLNHDQIPLDVLQMIENELNERNEDEE